MASWDGLRNYIKAHYTVATDELDAMALDFRLDDGRTQRVIVRRLRLGNDEWAEILTPVCREDDIAPRDALRRNSSMVVGGLALGEDGTIVFRHSLPLKDLDPDEFEVPFHLAVRFGDSLERELAGVDRY
jgi:hypothetical protein